MGIMLRVDKSKLDSFLFVFSYIAAWKIRVVLW